MKKLLRGLPLVFLAMSAVALAPRSSAAQDAGQVGAAIVRTCGTSLDPATQGVLAGVVSDSATSAPLPNARVKIVWQGGDDLSARNATVDTDGRGFYAFCGVPGGVMVLLSATLRVSSPARTVVVDPGMLTLEHIILPLSDPNKPGLVVGRVIDGATRAPVDGAEVKIRTEGSGVLTNARGYFVLGERESGTYQLQVKHLAYKEAELSFHVAGNLTQNLEVSVTTQPIELPGIMVTAAPTRLKKDMEGLIHRMDMGFGHFITRETLERRPQSRLSDLMRELPGILIFQSGPRAYAEVRGQNCSPAVYLDGMPFQLDPDVGLNQLFTQDLEAVEVYRDNEVPGEFLQVGFKRPCLAIVMWTRRGT